jgi:hypothetical protein
MRFAKAAFSTRAFPAVIVPKDDEIKPAEQADALLVFWLTK